MAKVTRKGTLQRKKRLALLAVDRGLIMAGMLVAQRAAGLAPIESGRLKRSITAGKPFSSNRGRAINVGTNVEYAAIQEFGGKIPPRKVIRPRVKKALSFMAGSKRVTVAAVYNWPGATIPAQPYLRPALQKSRKDVAHIVTSSIVAGMNSKA